MENYFEETLELTRVLSKYIRDQKIPITSQDKELVRLYREFCRIGNISNLGDMEAINHELKNHSDSKVKLDCGENHCIECYYELVQDDMWRNGQVYCSHSKLIIPKFRMIILNAYKKFQEMKRRCIKCNEIKDKMNFVLLSSHPQCVICTNCLKESYILGRDDNKCQNCGIIFVEECNTSLKEIIESEMTYEQLMQIYRIACELCHGIKDSRGFQKICKDGCKVCYECVQSILLKKRIMDKCYNCPNPISIMI